MNMEPHTAEAAAADDLALLEAPYVSAPSIEDQDAGVSDAPSTAAHRVHLLDPDGATSSTYSAIEHAYDYFNQTLFGGILPGALMTLRADRKSLSFFHHERFANEDGKFVDEIALNSAYFGIWPVECTLSVLVHEMCHQAMHHRSNVKPSSKKPGYHSKEWADQMIAVGLFPSSTGRPGGKSTGTSVGHYIIVGGYFEIACQALKSTEFGLHWFDRYPSTEALSTPSIISAAPVDPEPSLDASGEDHDQIDQSEIVATSPAPSTKASTSPSAQLLVVNNQIDASKKAAFSGGGTMAPMKEAVAQRPFPIKTGFEVQATRKIFDKEPDEQSFVIDAPFIPVPMSVVQPASDLSKAKVKVTYECPQCESRVWGKPSLVVLCGCDPCHPKMGAKD